MRRQKDARMANRRMTTANEKKAMRKKDARMASQTGATMKKKKMRMWRQKDSRMRRASPRRAIAKKKKKKKKKMRMRRR